MNTSGHLSNNGGVRGHSAGDFFPWRVMVKGSDTLRYIVINPDGSYMSTWKTSKAACEMARLCFSMV